jgi:hypothetical protein
MIMPMIGMSMTVIMTVSMIMAVMMVMPVVVRVTVSVIVALAVSMGMIMAVALVMVMMVMMAFSMAVVVPMVVAVPLVMAMMVLFRGIDVPARFLVHDIELGPHEPALAHLARPYAEPFQTKGVDMPADGFDVRTGVDQGAHEHVAADAG